MRGKRGVGDNHLRGCKNQRNKEGKKKIGGCGAIYEDGVFASIGLRGKKNSECLKLHKLFIYLLAETSVSVKYKHHWHDI